MRDASTVRRELDSRPVLLHRPLNDAALLLAQSPASLRYSSRPSVLTLTSSCTADGSRRIPAPKEWAVQRILSLATLGVLGGLRVDVPQRRRAEPARAPDAGRPLAGIRRRWPTLEPTRVRLGPPPAVAGQYRRGRGHRRAAVGEGPTIRIASFNIEVFGETKADKPDVMHTLRRDRPAVSRRRDPGDSHAGRLPSCRTSCKLRQRRRAAHYDFVVGPRLGNSTQTEQYAFVFDTDRIEISPHERVHGGRSRQSAAPRAAGGDVPHARRIPTRRSRSRWSTSTPTPANVAGRRSSTRWPKSTASSAAPAATRTT